MILAQRLYQTRFLREEDFIKTLDFCTAYQDCIDEIVLMAEYTMNAFFPIEEYVKLLPVLTDRVKRCKAHGFKSVGINVLCTIGHHNETSRFPDDGRFHPMVNYDGQETKACYCTNHDNFMQHIREKYEITAKANPDFIWIDDDVRMHMHDVADFPCFCPKCMEIFNEKNGTDFTREQLVEQLNSPGGGKYRALWVEQNVDTIDRICKNVEEAVHGVSPDIEIGFMHCNEGMSTYTGAAYKRWLTSLRCKKTRPGGGYYTDRMPLSYVEKGFECARSLDRYQDIVTDVQYEYEQFTYQRFLKSRQMAQIECLTVFANGLNGIAFNVLKLEPYGNLDDWNAFFLQIRKYRKLWEQMVEYSKFFHNEGVNNLLPVNYEKYRNVDEKGWFTLPNKSSEGYGNFSDIMHLSHTATLKSYVYNEIGIPYTMEEGRQAVTLLEGKMPEGLSKEELLEIFKGGVFVDGDALRCLENAGLSYLCGVSLKESYSNNIEEDFTADPLNGPYAGEIRDAKISLMKTMCYTLSRHNEKVRVLSNLLNANYEVIDPVCTVYENELGGRVAVLSHSPYNLVFSSAKIYQLREIFDWICHQKMPVKIKSISRIIPSIRVNETRKNFMLLLVNGNLDAEEDIQLDLRVACGAPLYELDDNGERVAIPTTDYTQTEEGISLHIPHMDAWGYRVIIG